MLRKEQCRCNSIAEANDPSRLQDLLTRREYEPIGIVKFSQTREGQVSVFDPAQDAPCYQCIFPEAPAPGLSPSCAEAGVIGPLPGVIGSIMAMEAVKIIANAGTVLRGEMLIYDGLYGETRKIALKRRTDCPCCGSK